MLEVGNFQTRLTVTDWEQFQSLASELISPIIQINSEEEPNKATCEFTASIASTYRLSTRKITLTELNNDLPSLERQLKHKRELRKLWQVTLDPACKAALYWFATLIRRMTRRKALEWWETKLGNCEVTPQALWPIAKSLMKRDGPKAPTAVHRPFGITYQSNEEDNVIADCLENQFISPDLCDESHERQVEITVQALPASVDNTPRGKLRPCDRT
jgi:hypothetical protein